jgi:hypothetical protein
MADAPSAEGSLSWRLSSHPVTLLCYLGFRIGLSIPPSDKISASPNKPARLPPHVPLRGALHPQLRPRLHPDPHPPQRRLLLPEEHRWAPARGPALVERSQHHHGRITLGVRERRAGDTGAERNGQALLLAEHVYCAGTVGWACGAGNRQAAECYLVG